ncbi:mediator of RNA polymerase II transcription subunit 11-like [Clavelina lepadiformis]|uniref:Mediator of RNA polymerase II transcription subunit 11 n=1 Tax=Clavelina lepadiformis TaxID=159417 RepID=A0ABP0G1H5_CLALP
MANVENVSNRLKKLEDIERKITMAIQSAGFTLQELAKDKPVERTLDKHTNGFMQTLDEVETELATQISYLSQVATSQQHEGSSYASRRNAQLLNESIHHVSKQIDEMVDSCGKMENKTKMAT